jgi:PBP1b-binding outer membrane lipoprotein LpoB
MRLKITILTLLTILFTTGCNTQTQNTQEQEKPKVTKECKVVNPINGKCEDE